MKKFSVKTLQGKIKWRDEWLEKIKAENIILRRKNAALARGRERLIAETSEQNAERLFPEYNKIVNHR